MACIAMPDTGPALVEASRFAKGEFVEFLPHLLQVVDFVELRIPFTRERSQVQSLQRPPSKSLVHCVAIPFRQHNADSCGLFARLQLIDLITEHLTRGRHKTKPRGAVDQALHRRRIVDKQLRTPIACNPFNYGVLNLG